MTPLQFLVLMLAMTALAGCWQWMYRRRQTEALRALAEELHMHYSAEDRFRLSPRIVQQLPAPGAAQVRVCDLLYGVEEANYRYIFRAEYTLGVLRSKVSVRRVGTFTEPRDRSGGAAREVKLTFAPDELGLLEQYRHLAQGFRPGG